MRRWKAGFTPSRPSWFTTPPMPAARPPSGTCSPTSKHTTTGSGSTPPSDTSPPNRQSFRPRNPLSTFPGEDHDMGLAVETRMRLLRDLRSALETDELVLLYQPQVALANSHITGA